MSNHNNHVAPAFPSLSINKCLPLSSCGRARNRPLQKQLSIPAGPPARAACCAGPAYIKLGQALSIRPDLLSPAAMNELQKLCDKVPSFDNETAMAVVQAELGAPWQEAYAELSTDPIAAASLGQVCSMRLHPQAAPSFTSATPA